MDLEGQPTFDEMRDRARSRIADLLDGLIWQLGTEPSPEHALRVEVAQRALRVAKDALDDITPEMTEVGRRDITKDVVEYDWEVRLEPRYADNYLSRLPEAADAISIIQSDAAVLYDTVIFHWDSDSFYSPEGEAPVYRVTTRGRWRRYRSAAAVADSPESDHATR